jgi:glycosyltransferase involved in cell wall biosynthesis
MHMLFLSDNFPPEVNAPASRTFEHCRAWVKAGHQVTVITCAPNFPSGRVFAGYHNSLWQSEVVEGIRVIRVWSYIARNEGFGRRIVDYLSYMVTSFMAALFVRKVDVVIGTSPQFFTACSAWAVAACKFRPFVFELRDIWPESIRAVGAMQEGVILSLLEWVEVFLYRRARMIVAVTRSFRKALIARGVEPDKIVVVTNGVDADQFQPMEKDYELTVALNLENSFVAGYLGTHGMAHGLDTLLDAAALLATHAEAADIRILLLGDGAERPKLAARVLKEQLTNVVMIDSVSKADVVRYWSLLDVSIIHLRRNPLFTTVIPSKMFEAMAMAIPIAMGVEGESAEIVVSNDVGLCFRPESATELADCLLRLRGDSELMARLSANGPRAAGRYDRVRLAREMVHLIEDAVHNR